MGKFHDAVTPALRDFIATQKIFFVASAPHQGRVNVSPKGLDRFRVLTPSKVGYLDGTGSGNETAAHLKENGRITIMFCAFDGDPLILRLYGHGRVIRPSHADWPQFRPLFGPPMAGERQLIVVDVESVQTSCGFGVPLFQFEAQRTLLPTWAERKGDAGIATYWSDKNVRSIDGLPTGIFE